MDFIYLDNSATTRISDEALKKYDEVSAGCHGNPSSLHELGFRAEKELDAARAKLLKTLGAQGAELVFTASGSEANNLAIIGRALAKERYRRGAKIITTEGEHASVSAPLERLEGLGFKLARIPTRGGALDLAALERELDESVILVTLMHVNNETGALYDIEGAARLIRECAPNAALHVDATQSYLKVKFTKRSLGADMISISAHKIEGPKGIGALIVDSGLIKSHGLTPLILGGGQEGGLRSGTENVPAAAAFGVAAEAGFAALDANAKKMEALRELLLRGLNEPRFKEISPTLPERHAPHIANLTLPNIKSETMLHFLSARGIYVSSGSACSSNSRHTSRALTAFGRSEAEADCSIRISFSPRNTEADVAALLAALDEGLRALSRIKR